MSDAENDDLLADVRVHVAAVIRDQAAEARVAGFARLYPAFAVLFVAFTFMPLYEPKPYDEDSTTIVDFGSLWHMIGRTHGASPAILGVLMLAALVALLLYCTFRLRLDGPAVPVGIAIIAGIIALMLVLKPGTGTVNPPLSAFGLSGVAMCVCLIGLAIAHTVVLRRILGGEDRTPR